MVTDLTCKLPQGYYDLPKAITDTVATESDVQMLVRDRCLCSYIISSSLAPLKQRWHCHVSLDAVTCRTIQTVTTSAAPHLSSPTAGPVVAQCACPVVAVHAACSRSIVVPVSKLLHPANMMLTAAYALAQIDTRAPNSTLDATRAFFDLTTK
jgi:hypothetical protein